MRFSVRKAVKGGSSGREIDVWEVLKTPDWGDPYLIAAFHHPSLARWCLSSLYGSVEVQRMGATVDEPPADMVNEAATLPVDMPDELIW